MKQQLLLFLVKALVLVLVVPLVSSCSANIPRSMAPVANGQGVPEAGEFDPNQLGPPPLVVLDTSGAPHAWNEMLSAEWRPSSVGETELVVVVGSEREINLGTQDYIGGPPITRYRFAADVEVRQTRTGQVLHRATLLGKDPDPFPGRASVQLTRLEGEHVTAAELETWIECQMQQRCRELTRDARFEGKFVFVENGDILAVEMGECTWARCRWDLWRISDGVALGEATTELRHEPTTGNVIGLTACNAVYSPDRTLWARIGYNDVELHRVRDGEVETERTVRRLDGHTERVNCVTFSPDGSLLATASQDRTVRLWRVADGALLRTLRAHRDYVLRVAFSPDGRFLVSSAYDGSVWVWKVSGILRSNP